MTAPVLAVLLAAWPAGVSASTGTAVSPAASFAVAPGAPVTLELVLTQFQRFDSGIKTLTAEFSQTLEMTDSPLRQSVAGTVAYRKPDRFRIEHLKPERQTIVSDGIDVWIHRHDRQQVVQALLKDWRAADPTLDNLLRFGRYAEMLETYAVALDTAGARPALTLTPKGGAAAFTLTLSLAPDTLFPESADMTAGSARMRTAFTRIAYNPDIEADAFAFTPPPDADVFRNFKPPRFAP